ncbi:hypothetical protein HAX54_014153, partial [Datura stramonium]|nr:hypothetical protein [Datura stramonium]
MAMRRGFTSSLFSTNRGNDRIYKDYSTGSGRNSRRALRNREGHTSGVLVIVPK